VDDAQITTAFKTIIVVQYVVPLLLGGPLLVPSIFDRVTAKNKTQSDVDEQGAPAKGRALAPLMCPSCGAAVSLESASFPCPHCQAQITPPDEYVRLFELRERAVLQLKRAERKWRLSRFTSSPLMTIPLRLAFFAWFFAIAAAGLTLDWPTPLLALAALLAGLQAFIGWFFVSVFSDAAKTLPPLPSTKFLKAPSSSGACMGCGAPIQFAADSFATICMYCGADNYREALAKDAQRDAGAKASAATKSLRDAIADLDGRRSELISFIGVMVIAELLYGGFLLIMTISDAIFGE
jgi:predicted RNA-binding Zn-ribbon protein involved in translation (DUF1610 family)